MPRQTDLSLEQLIALLAVADACGEQRQGGLSDGCLANEIGEIFWADGPDSVAAEAKLVELASTGQKGIHWVAYKYLSDDRSPRKTDAAREAILLYES